MNLTELTGRGRQFKRDNPADDDNALLESLSALGVELAWTKDAIRRCRIALAVSRAVWAPLFGVATVCATAASGIGRPSRPPVIGEAEAPIFPTNRDTLGQMGRHFVAHRERLADLVRRHDPALGIRASFHQAPA